MQHATGVPVGRPLREVVGEGVRRVREAAGVRQDDVARAAREHGLTWSRSKVAALERGDKAISPEELALLAIVLSDACGRDVAMPELIDPGALIHLSGSKFIGGHGLRLIYAGKPLESGPTTVGEGLALADAVAEPFWRGNTRARDLGLALTAQDWAAGGEAEEKAGRRLGEPTAVVVALSQAVWSRSLSEERDRLVSERTNAGDGPGRLRALRGRVTRQLTDQLAREIARRKEGEDVGGRETARG